MEKDAVIRTLLRSRGQVLAYVWAMVRDTHLAEDVFQEVSIIAMSKAGEIQDEAHLLKWARQTARYEALNALRRSKSDKLVFEDTLLDLLDEQWGGAAGRVDGDVDVALERCLEQLSPHAREVVRLRYRDELKGQSLAEKLGRKLSTTYAILTNIHQFLAECIDRSLHGEREVSHG